MKLNFLKKLRDWFFEDVSNRMASLEQQVSCLKDDMREIGENKKLKWQLDWVAVGAIGTCMGAIITIAMVYLVLSQTRIATEQTKIAAKQAKMTEIVLWQQAFSRAKIGFYPRNDYCSFIFANSGINPIQDGKKAVLLVAFPSGEKPICEQPILWPVDLLDPDDPKSISFHVPPPSGTNFFAFAVFHGTQEFLGEKRPIPKTKMMYRFGATWCEAPETFVTTGKCEPEIISLREQPILWEILQQFRSINENRRLNSP